MVNKLEVEATILSQLFDGRAPDDEMESDRRTQSQPARSSKAQALNPFAVPKTEKSKTPTPSAFPFFLGTTPPGCAAPRAADLHTALGASPPAVSAVAKRPAAAVAAKGDGGLARRQRIEARPKPQPKRRVQRPVAAGLKSLDKYLTKPDQASMLPEQLAFEGQAPQLTEGQEAAVARFLRKRDER